MKQLLLALFIFISTFPLHAQDELLRSTLAGFGLDSSTVGYRYQTTWAAADKADPFRLHFFDALLERPLKIPNYTRQMLWRYNLWLMGDSTNIPRAEMRNIRPLASLVMNSARNLGYDLGKYGFDYSPMIADREPLLHAVKEIYGDAGAPTGDNVTYSLPTDGWSDIPAQLRSQIGSWPLEFERSVASIVAAAREAARWRNASLAKIPREKWEHIFRSTTLEESQCDAQTFDQEVYDAALAFDLSSAHFGAMLLAQVLGREIPVLRTFAGATYSCDIPTPLGRIFVSGSGDDHHAPTDCLLMLDLGGNDTYTGPVAASSPSLPVAICIDLAGNDSYVNPYHDLPSQGAGVLGFGMLIDVAGDDHYVSQTFSQGCGRFGVGILHDAAGTDRYDSEGFSQGAGMYGSGILYDRTGNDEYHTVYYAQGYGFSKGLGLLVDQEGDDRYIANDTELTHVGDETPKHNESDAQGYGAGRRADHVDGHSMSGGIGILHDIAGDDEYFAGVFAQASSYWYGYGVLSDQGGNDKYRGVFFNLGAGAHWGIGVLFDDRGDDETDLVMTLGMGAAHDGSAAFYIDGDGNDRYTMSAADENAISFGGALNSAFGLFANIRGDDYYAPVGRSMGYSTGSQGGDHAIYGPTTGLFFDIGGNDTYNYKLGGNNTSWQQQDASEGFGLRSKGVDAEQGSLSFER